MNPRNLLAFLFAFGPVAALAGCSSPEADAPLPTAGTCTLALPTPPDAHLRAEGTKLKDALGRVVVLRGVNAGGRSKFAPFAPFAFVEGAYARELEIYLDRAAAWGINVLRVPFSWAAVEPSEGADDEAFLKRYDALLDAAWARGIYTIVDFHQDVYAEIFCGDGFPAWTVPEPHPEPHHDCPSWGTGYLNDKAMLAAFDRFWADGSPSRSAYEAMWDRMLVRHRDRPGVIGFEVINEPGWGTADPDTWEATTLTDFYGAMAARVRKAAPGALFFFDTTGINAVLVATNLSRPSGDGLVFAPHYYQYEALSGKGFDPDAVQPKLKRWSVYGEAWSVPVLLGEFGTSNETPDTEAYLAAHFGALDALGMSGTAWEYSVSADLWNAEDLSLVRADGTELPSANAVIRPYPRAVAGSDIAFSFDPAARTTTLRYTPTPGITELALPPRAYPEGYEISIQGACADASHPDRLLIQPDAAATEVEVHLKAR